VYIFSPHLVTQPYPYPLLGSADSRQHLLVRFPSPTPAPPHPVVLDPGSRVVPSLKRAAALLPRFIAASLLPALCPPPVCSVANVDKDVKAQLRKLAGFVSLPYLSPGGGARVRKRSDNRRPEVSRPRSHVLIHGFCTSHYRQICRTCINHDLFKQIRSIISPGRG
jgi:hypothetical protein